MRVKIFKFKLIFLIYFEILTRTTVSGRCGPLIPKSSQNVQVTCLGSVSQCKTSGAYIPNGSRAEIKCLDNYETADSTDGRRVLTCDWLRWVGQSLFNEIRCKIKCGRPVIENVGLVINGVEAERLKWPWHVAIFIDDVYACGGSIINPIGDNLFILTAVHCTTMVDGTPLEPKRLKVVIGAISSNLKENSRVPNTQILGVKQIIRHDNYDIQRHLEDIALIHTDKPIRVTPYSLPVCLPSNEIMVSGQVKASVTAGKVVGFGSTTGLRNAASEKLHEVTLPVVSTDACHDVLDQRPSISQICAGTPNGVNTCSGDSGGGLVFRADHPIRYTIQGIVSSAPQEYGCKGIIDQRPTNDIPVTVITTERTTTTTPTTLRTTTTTRRTTVTTTKKPSIPKVTTQPGSKDYEIAAVTYHNKFRQKHHAPDVTIDPELSQKAQKWSDHLIKTNSALKTGAECSENLYEFNGRPISKVEVVQEAIKHWYDTRRLYKKTDPKPSTFTQLVWKSSTKIGVGISSKNDRTIVVVCYSPGGNVHFIGDNGKTYKANVWPEPDHNAALTQRMPSPIPKKHKNKRPGNVKQSSG